MNSIVLKQFVKFQNLINDRDGQDLIEYAMLCTLICLALISSMNGIAKSITNTFSNISNSLS
jgi:Flp pilus assembly pilin Flp